MIIFKIIIESFRMASSQLWSNKLRSFLSLLGISIGIFCIISVLAAVDSLKQSIFDGFSELGSNIVYVDKQPWTESPSENYWKYLRRPDPSLADYEAIKERSDLSSLASFTFFTGGRTLQYKSNSLTGAFLMGATPEYKDVQNVEIEQGRFFTVSEYETGANAIIIGAQVKEDLFGEIEAIGKEVKLMGQRFKVIGVLKAEGDDIFNFMNFDQVVWMGLKTVQKFYNLNETLRMRSGQKLLAVKAKDGVELDELKDELIGILRSRRRIHPTEGDNFSLNESSMLEEVMGPVFKVLNIAGFAIGFFALIVGMISVANIMFVSVKERTSMIGVKKALGAKKFFILMEFLLEAIFLCIIGGILGLVMVFFVLKGVSAVIPFEMWMSPLFASIGVGVSVVVGILAGMVPAFLAARLDPVVAMRQ